MVNHNILRSYALHQQPPSQLSGNHRPRPTFEHAGLAPSVQLHAGRTEAHEVHIRVGELAVVGAAHLVRGAQVLQRCNRASNAQRSM